MTRRGFERRPPTLTRGFAGALVAFFCLAILASSAQREEGADEVSESLALERRLAARVSPERAQGRVRELVEFGPRMGGTSSGQRAARWRAKVFEGMGLGVELVQGEPAWCHEESSWTVVAHAQGQEPRILARAWPFGFSPAAKGRVTLSTKPAKGRAWIGSQPSRAARRSEAAVLLVDGLTTPAGDYPAARHLRAGAEAQQPVFGLSRDEGAWLRETLAAGVPIEIEFELEAVIRRAAPETIVASLPGIQPRASEQGQQRSYFLFCAHGDSDAGGPGANDNGSGEAIVLEIAQAWSAAVAAGEIARPPCEIRFAIWGTEIASTRHFLKVEREAGHRILGVVNFDQSGFGTGLDVLYLEPDDLPANRGLIRAMLRVLDDHAGVEGFPARFATTPSQGGTDSYVFSEHDAFQSGLLPSLTLYASAWDRANALKRTPGMPGESWNEGDTVHIDHDDYYHSAGDLPENTTDREPWNMAWSARIGWLGVRRWLGR